MPLTEPNPPDHAAPEPVPDTPHDAPGRWFALLTACAYGGFLLAGAFASHALGRPALGSIPWSFVLGAGLLVGTVAVTGLYVLLANARERGTR